MHKILIIEDDSGISNSLKLYLENSQFEVVLHMSGEGAIEIIKKEKPTLIILDINLPVIDGVSICKQLRTFSDVPVIMLTARSSEIDKVSGLESGADDYISKPFSPRELLARVSSLLRRLEPKQEEDNSHILSYDDIKIDTKKNLVTKNGVLISFTKNEFDILKKIFEEQWNIVSRKTIMKEIIGYNEYAFDRTIDTHLKNIRKKISWKNIILTIRWEWYRLNK